MTCLSKYVAEYIAARVVFCRSQVAAALKRGDEKEEQEWQEIVDMWEQSAYFDEIFPKPEAEEGQ